jgi:RimJ/RimL family protein N-acetyltransferase
MLPTPKEGIQRIVGSILNDNFGMLQVAQQLGFKLQGPSQDGVMRVEFQLPSAAKTQ